MKNWLRSNSLGILLIIVAVAILVGIVFLATSRNLSAVIF